MHKLRKAIIAIQTDLNVWVEKNQKVAFKNINYKAFNETAVFNVLKPKLKAHGIGYLIEVSDKPKLETIQTQTGISFLYQNSGFLHLFLEDNSKDANDNEQIKLAIDLMAINTDPAKAMGSALTYATKYWLCKLFGLATDELDPDTTENTANNQVGTSTTKTGTSTTKTGTSTTKTGTNAKKPVEIPKTVLDAEFIKWGKKAAEIAGSDDEAKTKLKSIIQTSKVKGIKDLTLAQIQNFVVSWEAEQNKKENEIVDESPGAILWD